MKRAIVYQNGLKVEVYSTLERLFELRPELEDWRWRIVNKLSRTGMPVLCGEVVVSRVPYYNKEATKKKKAMATIKMKG